LAFLFGKYTIWQPWNTQRCATSRDTISLLHMPKYPLKLYYNMSYLYTVSRDTAQLYFIGNILLMPL
jgi:hypothetical protein